MSDRGWDIAVDGLYGANTNQVATDFQAEKGLTVDGKIGPATWDAAWTYPIT
jgi:peptidoglycan hydrolase-like protein with peptidoglycan-binding domain